MLSFKQYLKEDTTVFPDFVIELTTDHFMDSVCRKKIEKEINKYPSCDYCEIKDDTATMIFSFTSPSLYHTDLLDNLFYEIKETVEGIVYECANDNKIVVEERNISFQSEMPTFEIDYPYIDITLDPNNSNVSEVYKFIGNNCEKLTFVNIDQLRSYSGLLKILKIKAEKVILGTFAVRHQWVNILQKHLDHDRNIRKCKFELNEAGLDGYGI